MRYRLFFLLLATALLLSASAAGAANSIAVTSDKPLNGTFSLAANFDGSPNRNYLIDNRPLADHLLNLNMFLYLDAAGAFGPAFSMANGEAHQIYRVLELNPSQLAILLILKRSVNGAYIVRLIVRDGPGLVAVGHVAVATDVWQRIRVKWQAATEDGAGDGFASLQRGAAGPLRERLNADNRYHLDQQNLGIVAGADPSTTGSYYFDEFSSFRTLAP